MRITRTDGTLIGDFASVAEAVKSGANLREADLREANLSEAALRGTNLDWANLSGANLSGADLRGADLCGTNLRGANLRGADLSGTNLRGANLSWADLSEANLCEANLRWADLGGADLRGADLCGADLRGTNLRGANLDGVRWNNSILTNTIDGPWHFGLGGHVAIVHEGKISIGCMTEPIEWWLDHYEAVGKTQGYSEAEIAEYGAWIQFVAVRLKLRDGGTTQEERC